MKITEKSRKNLLKMNPDTFDPSKLSDEESVALINMDSKRPLLNDEDIDILETRVTILGGISKYNEAEIQQGSKIKSRKNAIIGFTVAGAGLALGPLTNWWSAMITVIGGFTVFCIRNTMIAEGIKHDLIHNNRQSHGAKLLHKEEVYGQDPSVEELNKFQAAHKVADCWQRSVQTNLFKNTELDQYLLSVLDDNKQKEALSHALGSGVTLQLDKEIPTKDEKSKTIVEYVTPSSIIESINQLVNTEECSPKTRIAWNSFCNSIKATIGKEEDIAVLGDFYSGILPFTEASYTLFELEAKQSFVKQLTKQSKDFDKQEEEEQPLLPKKSYVKDIEAGNGKGDFNWQMNL